MIDEVFGDQLIYEMQVSWFQISSVTRYISALAASPRSFIDPPAHRAHLMLAQIQQPRGCLGT